MTPPERASRSIEPLFPPASADVRGLPPERIALNQRRRLEHAMVEAVARYGYAGTTLRELVRLAGVSKTTFYGHFESKEACFLATFDVIVEEISARVEAAYRVDVDFEERLLAACNEFMDIAVAEPDAVGLVTVESLTLGAAGFRHREKGSRAFVAMLRQGFDSSPDKSEVSDLSIRVIAAGIRGVVYRRLRSGDAEQLPGLVPVLVDWALSYQEPAGEAVVRAAEAAAEPRAESGGSDVEPAVPWDEPPDNPRSRSQLTQRERIVRAVGQLVVESGFETLSIPAISARAGTSNQTFYENFSNKRDAFFAAFDDNAARGLLVVTRAFDGEGERPEAIGAAVRALLEHISRNALFAHLTFFDLQTAGPVAYDRADAVMESFTGLLERERGPEEGADPAVPGAVLTAIGGGVWSAIQQELAEGRGDRLPQLAPDLARVVLTPLISR